MIFIFSIFVFVAPFLLVPSSLGITILGKNMTDKQKDIYGPANCSFLC
jgi:hypothetical protein